MKLTKHQVRQFQSMIFRWWKTNKRDLPWRRTRDPYLIAVSEVMLQQTQVSRVLPKYKEFIAAFPTVASLSRVPLGSVLRVWKGMGYNRRALHLHKIAKMIVAEYGEKFPQDEQLLTKLPGLGKYTARAILVFAFGKNIACVDTNIRQIITHFFFNDIPQKPSVIQEAADQLLPKDKSWQWHQALMDFGAIELSEIKRIKRRDVPYGTSQARRTTIPFKNSNRFFRGRIIDLLRERDWKEEKLVLFAAKTYERPASFIRQILQGLADDGLTVRVNGIVSLPQ